MISSGIWTGIGVHRHIHTVQVRFLYSDVPTKILTHSLQLRKSTRRGIFHGATEEHREGSLLELLPRPEHHSYCYKVISPL